MKLKRTIRAAVCVALTACTSAKVEQGNQDQPSPSLTLNSSTVSGVYSIFNFYYMGGLSSEDLNLRMRESISACMVSKGWKYYAANSEEVGNTQEPQSLVDRLKYRQQYGYGISGPPPPSTLTHENDPNVQYFESLSEAARVQYADDLGGDSPPSGCNAQLVEQVTSKIPMLAGTYADTAQAFATQLLTSATYMDAIRSWQKCISSAGYSAESPEEMRSQFIQKFDAGVNSNLYVRGDPTGPQGEFFRQEVAAALTDFQCDYEFLHPTRMKVEGEILQQMVENQQLPASWLTDPEIHSPG
jgi:hypothetical protein